MRQIVILSGPDQGRVFPLTSGEDLMLGRSKATQTRLTDPHVSRVHCLLEVTDDTVRIKDFESTTGTQVNGKRVPEQVLKHGDVIRIGATEIRLLLEPVSGTPGSARAPRQAAATPVPKPAATPKPTPAAPIPFLPEKPTPASPEDLAKLVDKMLAGYVIQSIVAKGENGMVFLALDTRKERTVALKVLWPEYGQIDEERHRFVRAMKAMLPLRHPNLVAVHNAGKTGPYCWAAMEYVEGESAAQTIKRIGIDGKLDWRYAFGVAFHMARALEFLQQNQIIHRNIKPSNILVRKDDNLAKLSDPTLAKGVDDEQQVSLPGELVGDLAYMAPEQASGRGELDGRTDIYNLGATLYALLTGRPPFQGKSLHDVLAKIYLEPPVPPGKMQMELSDQAARNLPLGQLALLQLEAIPDAFEKVVLKMLAKRPEDRHQTAADLLADLKRIARES